MKSLFTLIGSLLLTFNLTAQAPVMTVGESSSAIENVPQEFIGETEKYFLLKTWEPGLSLSSVLNNAAMSTKDLRVALFDKTSLKLEKAMPFPEFRGEGVTKTGSVSLEEILVVGDTLLMFTNVWDKEAKEYAIHGWMLNANTMEPLTSEAKLITKIPDSKKSDLRKLGVEYFESLKRTALVYFAYDKKTSKTTITTSILDLSLNEVRRAEMVMEGTRRGTGIQSISIDKKENIYILYAVSEVEYPSWEDPTWLKVAYLPASGDKISEVDIQLDNGGNPVNGEVVVSRVGDVFVVGHYALMVDPKEGDKEFYGGSYIAEIDPASGDVIKKEEMEFTENQKAQLTPNSLKPNNPARSRYNQMSNMKIDNLFYDESGNITLVGKVEYYTVSISGSRRIYNYFDNSMVVTRFKPDVTIPWQTVIPRLAYLSQMNFAVMPVSGFVNGKVHILFNDDNDNIEPLTEVASGKKSSSKSSSSKPKTYPPTDRDDPVKLSVWNLKGSAIRHTVIDESGMWQINWIVPKNQDEDAKIPAIEGSCSRKTGDNEYVMTVFTKYGMFGFRQFALARFKF